MTTTDHAREAAVERAKDFYNSELRAKLEPSEKGKYVVIDGYSLDYEVDANMIVASVHLQDRQPDARMVVFRVAYDLNWFTRSRRDASRPDKVAEEFNGDVGKKIPWPEINRSPASLEAENFYNAELRVQLEPVHTGKYILIAGKTHDYEIDSDPIVAAVHLLDRQPGAEMFMFCIGDDSHQSVFHGLRFHI